ncbi:MAG: hypothetical protein H0W58_16845 [Acidobacteria bacterium]|nr:hypothetical protein [Acidobacteriota bacterium]
MFLRFNTFILLFAVLFLTAVSSVFAQETANKKEKSDKKTATPTAEQVAESVILIYGGLGGRQTLDQIRKTALERGKITVKNAEGKTEQANYERWSLRGDSLDKERIRFDQEFPTAKFALIYNGEKVFGLFNNSVFAPREDASQAFENQIWHGLEALLRYKENGSTLELAKRDKVMGVDYYVVDVTDKQNRKTRFYVSAKKFRVMMLEYTEGNVNYRRKFYDYNYAQGTLVPYRTVLWANDNQIEESEVQTISFGQKIDDNLFQGS